jgi:hypothetical protein
VSGNLLTGVDEMVKISAPGTQNLQHLDSMKLICPEVHAETGFINFKGCCPFNNNNLSGLTVKKELAIHKTFTHLSFFRLKL